MKEVDAQDSPVVGVRDGMSDVGRYADHVLKIPETDPRASAVPANVRLQVVATWGSLMDHRGISGE